MDAQTKLREAGIIPVILKMIRHFQYEQRLMKSVISAIGSLSQDDVNRDVLISSGACELIVDAVRYHIENPEILNIYANSVVVLAQEDHACERIIAKQNYSLNASDIERIMDAITKISE
jgi:hypothetical protein